MDKLTSTIFFSQYIFVLSLPLVSHLDRVPNQFRFHRRTIHTLDHFGMIYRLGDLQKIQINAKKSVLS